MEQPQEGEREQLQRAPPQQQHKCPRCDSMNTKFCYFNNYSLSQPRHFCKTCKRYWTQGGTFRNIPVGGGSRKGKRARSSASAFSNALSLAQAHPNLLRPSPSSPSPTLLHAHAAAGPSTGFWSPLATLHSLNPSRPFSHHYLKGGDAAGSSSTSSLLSGFNAAPSSLPPRFHHMYPAPASPAPATVAASHTAQLPQSLFVTNNNATSASLWSTASNTDPNNVRAGSGASSFIPNHWLHLPGYAPPQ